MNQLSLSVIRLLLAIDAVNSYCTSRTLQHRCHRSFWNANTPVGLLKQADSAEYRAACRLLNVFLSTKNELLQGAEGEEAEDDEDGEDGENPSASMEEEVKKNDRSFSVCLWMFSSFYY